MPNRRKTRRVKKGGDVTEITTVLNDDQKENIETFIGVDVDQLVEAMNTVLSPPEGENISAATSIVAEARAALQDADEDDNLLEYADNLREIFNEFDEKMGNTTGGGRRRRGGIPRDIVEGLHAAYQKGVADAKMPVLKRFPSPPGFRLEAVIPPLVRKHPSVEESRIREEYVKGFVETRIPNPHIAELAGQGRRRKTKRATRRH